MAQKPQTSQLQWKLASPREVGDVAQLAMGCQKQFAKLACMQWLVSDTEPLGDQWGFSSIGDIYEAEPRAAAPP